MILNNKVAYHKQNITRAFNEAANNYDDNCFVQKLTGSKLIDYLRQNLIFMSNIINKKNTVIIDLGCGTGLITEQLLYATISNHKNELERNLYVLDISDIAIKLAKARLNKFNIRYLLGDFESNFWSSNKVFTLIFSNMALQWSLSLFKTLEIIYASLAENGILAFTVPLQGTLIELSGLGINNFYTIDKLIAVLNDIGFAIDSAAAEKIIIDNHSFRYAVNLLKKIGVNYVISDSKQKAVNANKIKQLKALLRSDEPFAVSYNIGFFVLHKE